MYVYIPKYVYECMLTGYHINKRFNLLMQITNIWYIVISRYLAMYLAIDFFPFKVGLELRHYISISVYFKIFLCAFLTNIY